VKRQPHLGDQVGQIDPLNSVLPAVARTSIWGSRTRLGLDPVGSAKSQPHSGFAVGVRRRTPPAPPPRHPRQPWRWPSNLRRPIAELPTSNPGSSTPQHRCRSGSTSTRPGVCTPTGWCTIPAERTRRAITKATTCTCPRPTAAQPQRLAHWPWHARRACRSSLRHQDSDEDPPSSARRAHPLPPATVSTAE